jgi:hypothetical protein
MIEFIDFVQRAAAPRLKLPFFRFCVSRFRNRAQLIQDFERKAQHDVCTNSSERSDNHNEDFCCASTTTAKSSMTRTLELSIDPLGFGRYSAVDFNGQGGQKLH